MKRNFTALLTLVMAASAQGATFTMVDGNSTASVNTGAQTGMSNWLVDGQNQLFQQWFWFRVGSSPEQSVDALNIGAQGLSDGDFNGSNESFFVRYVDPQGQFNIEIRYLLTGGMLGSHTSDVAETIKINNLSGSSLDFHFFQYSDFDLGANASPDTVSMVNANTISQTDLGAGIVFSETVVTPSPNHLELDVYNSTLIRLNDGVATTLDDDSTSVTGDATWAFQWDATLAGSGPGSSFIISKDKRLSPTPEPASLAIWSLIGGIGAVAGWRRNRRKA